MEMFVGPLSPLSTVSPEAIIKVAALVEIASAVALAQKGLMPVGMRTGSPKLELKVPSIRSHPAEVRLLLEEYILPSPAQPR